MKQTNLRWQIERKLAAYPNLFELFKDKIPHSPALFTKIYNDVNVE